MGWVALQAQRSIQVVSCATDGKGVKERKAHGLAVPQLQMSERNC